jgi:hypothetical protein
MTLSLALPVSILIVTGMLCFTGLRAWRGWLELRRLEIARGHDAPDETGVRIELASVRERLKKLEAIASGVDP